MPDKDHGLLAKIMGWFGLGDEPKNQPKPDVTWMLLPPYDITGMAVVSGLLVENQGWNDAENVYISLTYKDERFITHMEVISDEPYELKGGGPRDSYLTVQLPQLRAGKKVVVYVASHTEQKADVIVSISPLV